MTLTDAARTRGRAAATTTTLATSTTLPTTTAMAAAPPRYRLYPVEVADRRRLGPSFVRLTFTGEDLPRFGAAGHDQRVKLLLPRPGRSLADVPATEDGWYAAWRALPDTVRPTMRTYTVRDHRAHAAELDIDFVLHASNGHPGPASAWAAGARPGDPAGLLGPDRPGAGRLWGCEWAPPENATTLLLAGDETAVPAAGAIVESLGPDRRGVACLEVPAAGDRQDWDTPDGFDVRWLVRDRAGGRPDRGALLEDAVREFLDDHRTPGRPGAAPHAASDAGDAGDAAGGMDVDGDLLWEVPSASAAGGPVLVDGLYAWLAGEAAVIRRLRRLMLTTYAVPRTSVAFMGYWRQGRTELG